MRAIIGDGDELQECGKGREDVFREHWRERFRIAEAVR